MFGRRKDRDSVFDVLRRRREIRKAWGDAEWRFIKREHRRPTLSELIAERTKEW